MVRQQRTAVRRLGSGGGNRRRCSQAERAVQPTDQTLHAMHREDRMRLRRREEPAAGHWGSDRRAQASQRSLVALTGCNTRSPVGSKRRSGARAALRRGRLRACAQAGRAAPVSPPSGSRKR